MITQAMITTTVPWTTWLWPGHSTLRSSAIDSRMKRFAPRPSRAASPAAALGWVGLCDGRVSLLPPPAPASAARPSTDRAPHDARAAQISSGRAISRVSRCGVCWPHQRQYFFSSTRSGVFRFDFIDS